MKFALLSLALFGLIGSATAKAESAWPFWDHYAARFLSSQGRVIDPDRNEMTTSEGQSYAMFFALVANDHASFQRIFSWTTNSLAQADLAKNLPAWSWGRKDDGSWGVLDSNSAADADLWIAYSLIEAGELWGPAEYTKTGNALLSLIAQEEVVTVPEIGPLLLPGKSGFHPDSGRWILNPSYMPLPLLFAANHFDPNGPWKQMALALPGWLQQGNPAGFAMDWVLCDSKRCSPSSESGDSAGLSRGSYDAIRVYLWAGMTNSQTPGAEKLTGIFAPMSQYVKAHSAPPETVGANGIILSTSAPTSFAVALAPFLLSSGERPLAMHLQRNVIAEISSSTGLLGSPARYYDQNLALFSLGWLQQRFRFAPDGTLRVQWKK
jgi:endo-1,4-beta-D-glucanase Y